MKKSTEDHLPPYRVRPRFQVVTEDNFGQLEDKIDKALKEENAPCTGRVNPGYITLYLPAAVQHYWSPQLSITLDETEEGKTLIRGVYGPRPAVWTMFVFFYAILGFAILVISIIGMANLSLEKSGTVLWLVPLLVVAFLSLYLVAFFGQKAGHDQMVTLHQFLEESTGLNIDREHQAEAERV
ncbi:hypothetical protein [Lewinella sp. LCG006]|uniref:hypothetical protein n=1 Tax=Lewinella sp. LCG006 TaxID=3231911 RepID=UPI0034605C1F